MKKARSFSSLVILIRVNDFRSAVHEWPGPPGWVCAGVPARPWLRDSGSLQVSGLQQNHTGRPHFSNFCIWVRKFYCIFSLSRPEKKMFLSLPIQCNVFLKIITWQDCEWIAISTVFQLIMFFFYWSWRRNYSKFRFSCHQRFFRYGSSILCYVKVVMLLNFSVALMKCGLLDGAVVFFPSRDTSHHSNTDLYSSPTSCHQGTPRKEYFCVFLLIFINVFNLKYFCTRYRKYIYFPFFKDTFLWFLPLKERVD